MIGRKNGGNVANCTMINLHNYNITTHFSTPLLHLNNRTLANEMLPICRDILSNESLVTNAWGYKNTYDPGTGIAELPEMNKFKQYTSSVAREFLQSLGYGKINFEPQIFTSQMNKKDSHGRHAHAGAVLSGVFYLNMPEGASPIQFYDPRPWRDTRVLPVSRETEYTRSSFNFTPSVGDFIMWESWLHHEVIPNECDDRVTLVFNL
jgi:uncharacterized protein (TIGR02466 family)